MSGRGFNGTKTRTDLQEPEVDKMGRANVIRPIIKKRYLKFLQMGYRG